MAQENLFQLHSKLLLLNSVEAIQIEKLLYIMALMNRLLEDES